MGIVLTVLGVMILHRLVVDLPSPDRLYERAAAPSMRIYDRHGRLLYEILDPHGGAHTPVSLAEIPPDCLHATIATEDASFYRNPGVDAWAIIRALWINIQGGEILSGGSTITQQLARNLLLSPEERSEVTLERKLRETILAWRLARTYTKDEILTLYLNESNYGNLAYGIEAAAQTYFARHASELDLAQCALLAGMPQAPAYYNPLENPKAARARRQVVLGLMVEQGYISQQEADLAAREPLHLASVPFPIEAPHFVMYVRGMLEQKFGREAMYTQGLVVTTTLDLDIQHTVERIVRYRLAQLADTRFGQLPRNVNNAAVIVMDPQTGEILAMVGSPDYFNPRIDGAVNGTITLRQPGSSIKPITYAAAFDPTRPTPLTPATMMVDMRTAYVTREGMPYVPYNYNRQWHGPVLLRQALASSYNLVAVKVLADVGIAEMSRLARAMGITTFDDVDRWGLSLTLGGGEVRLLELTAAYGAFANGGYRLEPIPIHQIRDHRGHLLYLSDTGRGERVLDERVAYLITDILKDPLARMSSFGEDSVLRLTRPAAVKTGTTSDWRDNWTLGYTPDLLVGVWVGNANNEPMNRVSGVTGAGPIWHDVMETMLKGQPVRDFVVPEGIVRVEVCADSGLLPVKGESWPIFAGRSGSRHPVPCQHRLEEVFIAGSEPTRTDDWHWIYALDVRNGLLAGPDCPAELTVWRRYTLYPAEAQDWVRVQNIPQPPETYSPFCPSLSPTAAGVGEAVSIAAATQTDPPLVMTSPDPGSRYRMTTEMPASAQQVLVAARPADGISLRRLTLLVDGRPLATRTAPPYYAFWPMSPGRHRFTAQGVQTDGTPVEAASVLIEVVPSGGNRK